MLTPQEVQEKTFVKAVFGGYDMQTVDDFIDVLSADYSTLVNENTVLKSKMKVLVDRLEEYRNQEDSMKKALLAAQRTADELVASTQKKCDRAIQDAVQAANDKVKRYEATMVVEAERVEQARQEANAFIGRVQDQVSQTVQALEDLKLTAKQEVPQPRPRAYDYEAEADNPAALAKKSEKSVEKLVGEPEPASAPAAAPEPAPEPAAEAPAPVSEATKVLPTLSETPVARSESGRQKYNLSELQFGANYNPKG